MTNALIMASGGHSLRHRTPTVHYPTSTTDTPIRVQKTADHRRPMPAHSSDSLFPDHTRYVGNQHLSRFGYRVVARAIADFLLAEDLVSAGAP